jgi:hypothetical protein
MKRLLPIVLLLACPLVLAESGSYRVEIIIFENLGVAFDTAAVEQLRDFSKFPSIQDADLPEDLIALEQKSNYMDGVWRRLKSSKGYKPLLFAAWEQNRTDYYPPMRVHDDTVLDQQLRSPTNIMVANLEAEDPLAVYLSTFFQLDGTVQLRRSRFLHLFLDLEFRHDPFLPAVQPSFFSAEEANPADHGKQRTVFSLQQNRQIRTGRLQYFDTPYFGALVLVTALRAK